MKYIGPFLRMNSLKKENIESQLIYLSKESVKHIVFKSKCGVTISPKELKIKNIPNFDINTFKSFSPLLCVYKKCSSKLSVDGDKLYWNEDSFKKEVIISGNAFMTLCLLELSEYYMKFKNLDEYKYSLGILYLAVAKKQLEFYTSYLRNEEGVFVDKENISEALENELKFEKKKLLFNFSDQALIMSAFYKCSELDESADKANLRNFSLDIFNMFLDCKEDLYKLSRKELSKLCLALNIFFDYSKNEDAKLLLLDLLEYMMENHPNPSLASSEDQIEQTCISYINCILFARHTGIMKFKDSSTSILNKLINLYDNEAGIFIKKSEDKEVTFTSVEILLYLLSLMQNPLANEEFDDNTLAIIRDIFRHQIVDSSIILSWPDPPGIEDRERYRNYSLNAEDILDEQFFRLSSIASPENSERAPIFVKKVIYNKKKSIFTQSRTSFDSSKNFYIFFMILYLIKPGTDFNK